MEVSVIIVVVIVTALAFDFTNGFHDTANAVATSIATDLRRAGRGDRVESVDLAGGAAL
jgi:phosphate/sulfate permease